MPFISSSTFVVYIACKMGFKRKKRIKCSDEVTRKRKELFALYVEPHLEFIRSLCTLYSNNSNDVDDNYSDVLMNLFLYIETYDTSMKLTTWIHISTKRRIYFLNSRESKHRARFCGLNSVTDVEYKTSENVIDGDPYNEDDISDSFDGVSIDCSYSDDIELALEQTPDNFRRSFLLSYQGYSPKEIAQMENKMNGSFITENTIRHRIRTTKQQLRTLLNRNGEYQETK